MKKKFIGLAALVALASVTLSSCGQSTRNSSTPTGDLALSSVVAESGDYKLTNEMYYNKLRYNANDIVTKKIKETLYSKELVAIKELFNSTSAQDLSASTINLLIPSKDNEKLFSLDGDELVNISYEKIGKTTNYDVLKTNLMNSINSSLSSSIFSTQSSESIKNKTDKERAKAVKTYITSNARKGITLTTDDLNFTYATDDSDFNIISFDNIVSDALASIVNPLLLSEAEKLSAQNALYQIADVEYIKAYDADEDDSETKNSNYIFKQTTIEDKYESSYQTFGTYHAVYIQFNSRKEAFDTLDKLKADKNIDFKDLTNLDEAINAYKELYNEYYEYKKVDSLDDEKFIFEKNIYKDDFSDIPSGVKELIQTTLEDNDYLTEPRNIDNKYVMAIRLDTNYYVSNSSEETKYSELSENDKKEYDIKIKYNTLISSASNYISTNFKSMVYNRSNNDDKNDDILIYDPLFEQKFYSSYSTDYVCIDKSRFENDAIFSIDGNKYTVADFYNDATKAYANTIVTNYFELEYAYKYSDTYVDSDTHDSNVESLTNTINDFNAGKNTTYDKEIGESTFLLATYGYTNKDDIVKYYYDASTCLTSYLNKNIFEDWAKKVETDGTTTYTYADGLDESGILYNLLSDGNDKYSDLFSINLDHFLINIDDDGDGTPDDPKKFLSKMSDADQADFNNAVVALARALYTEALDPTYENNSLYKILTFIKTQYEEGAPLRSDNTKTWDDFKKYNFLITVEQLASNGDITQSTVSNFVTPFADYVKGVFKTCVENSVKESYDKGAFYVYNTVTEEGKVIDEVTEADEITIDTLCETVYGYHVLILNSYSKAKETAYTENDDTSKVQSNIQLLIKEDEDDSSNNIYITIDSYNSLKSEVSFNQFFIYYIQKANGVESSLSSNISTLLSNMYDNLINTYNSSNFQSYLLIKSLNITSTNETISSIINAEKNYHANVVCDYAESNADSDYYDWVFGNMNWTRPEK